jgi:hypothetical protein
VHERAAGEKAATMPRLEKIEQMVPAGWAGTADVWLIERDVLLSFEDRCEIPDCSLDPSPIGNLDLLRSRMVLDKVSSPVMESVSEPPVPFRLEHAAPTPLDIAEWLRDTPDGQWPTSYAGLRDIGLHEPVIDWLRSFAADNQDGQTQEESVVVAFLVLMSRPAMFEALRHRSLTPSLFRSLFKHFAADANGRLGRLLLSNLQDMLQTVWPHVRVPARDDESEGVSG